VTAMAPRRDRWWWGSLGASAGAMLLFMVLPVAALFLTLGVEELWAGIRHPLVAPALWLSLRTTAASLAIIVAFGTPLAWLIGRHPGRWSRWVEPLVRLPAVLPPAVAGVALLLAFGRRGLLGSWLAELGLTVAFSSAAVVLAQVFVAAPFFLQSATAAFRSLDEDQLTVARTLGASPARVFFEVALPLARPGLVVGAAMGWARALGEFGATLMFAGNLTGETQTMTLAIYTTFESDLRAAQAISVVLVIVAFGILFLLSVPAEQRARAIAHEPRD